MERKREVGRNREEQEGDDGEAIEKKGKSK